MVDYEAIFRREFPAVVRDVALVVGDREAAREITQEAFTRLYLHWRKVSGYDKPGAWVRRVAIRMAAKARVRETRRATAMQMTASSGVVDAAPRDEALHAALDALPRKQRAAVVLHYLHDLSVADVAETLGCRTATAKVHLHRARTRLAQLLNEEEETIDVA